MCVLERFEAGGRGKSNVVCQGELAGGLGISSRQVESGL